LNTSAAVEVLCELHEVLPFPFWIDQGTLLGAVRDGKIIDGDTDIDLGTYIANISAFLSFTSELEKLNYNIEIHDNEAFIIKNDVPVTIAFYRLLDGSYYIFSRPFIGSWLNRVRQLYDAALLHDYVTCVSSSGHCCRFANWLTNPKWIRPFWYNLSLAIWKLCGGHEWNMRVPEFFYRKLDAIRFCGLSFLVPNMVETYLDFKYSSNWKVACDKGSWPAGDDGAVKLSLPHKKFEKIMCQKQGGVSN
jgi:hypothetical protein